MGLLYLFYTEILRYKNILLCGCETWFLALRCGLQHCHPVVLHNWILYVFVCLGENDWTQKFNLNTQWTNIKRVRGGDLWKLDLSGRQRWRINTTALWGTWPFFMIINPLTPNGHYIGRTAPLTSRRCILNIYSTNIRTEYFKHVA
jgi:hypothetical protein